MARTGRPKSAVDTRVQHVRFDVPTLNHLEEIASNQGGRSVSSVIRQIVEDYLKSQQRQPESFEDFIQGSPAWKHNEAISKQKTDGRHVRLSKAEREDEKRAAHQRPVTAKPRKEKP